MWYFPNLTSLKKTCTPKVEKKTKFRASKLPFDLQSSFFDLCLW